MILSAASDFRDNFPEGGRLAGLDVGTKTIGIAICDAMWTIATPAETIARKKFSVDLALLKIAKKQKHLISFGQNQWREWGARQRSMQK